MFLQEPNIVLLPRDLPVSWAAVYRSEEKDVLSQSTLNVFLHFRQNPIFELFNAHKTITVCIKPEKRSIIINDGQRNLVIDAYRGWIFLMRLSCSSFTGFLLSFVEVTVDFSLVFLLERGRGQLSSTGEKVLVGLSTCSTCFVSRDSCRSRSTVTKARNTTAQSTTPVKGFRLNILAHC